MPPWGCIKRTATVVGMGYDRIHGDFAGIGDIIVIYTVIYIYSFKKNVMWLGNFDCSSLAPHGYRFKTWLKKIGAVRSYGAPNLAPKRTLTWNHQIYLFFSGEVEKTNGILEEIMGKLVSILFFLKPDWKPGCGSLWFTPAASSSHWNYPWNFPGAGRTRQPSWKMWKNCLVEYNTIYGCVWK